MYFINDLSLRYITDVMINWFVFGAQYLLYLNALYI